MLALCEKLGFRRSSLPDDPGIAQLTLSLGAAPEPSVNHER